jgi:beta-barrel assembly-enhancing protease
MKALVFGPGLPAAGTHGTVSISSIGLEAVAGGQSKRAHLSQLSIRETGFDGLGVELAWTEGPDSWAVHVLDGRDAEALLAAPALASTSQVSAFRSSKRQQTVRRLAGWTLLAALVLLPLLLLLVLILNGARIAGLIAERVPIEQEMDWGRQAFEGMRGAMRLQADGPATEAVRAIGSRLTQGLKFRYEFHVIEDKTLNAFAMPGGVIVVHSGLIAATRRPEELAGVLAHEVQHVELRHALRGMVKDLGLRGLWTLATGDLGASIAGQAALEITSLKFSRDDELEADRSGLEALIGASIDPSGMPAFFKTMDEKATEMPVDFLSTHPSSGEREAILRERVAAVAKSFPPLDLGRWPPD